MEKKQKTIVNCNICDKELSQEETNRVEQTDFIITCAEHIKELYEYEQQSGNSLTFAQMKPLLEKAKEMEQQIIDNQEICSHPDKEFVSGVFGGYWCSKCNRNVDSEVNFRNELL